MNLRASIFNRAMGRMAVGRTGPASVSGWVSRCRMILLAGLVMASAFPGFAQTTKEYQLKAVFLFRLAQFVEWPTNAFSSPDSPIVIGVIGADPFGEALDLAVQNETAHNRRIVIQRFRRPDDITSCHILFISRAEAARVRKIVEACSVRSILTVSDIDDFVSGYGGMIRFETRNNKVILRIDPDAVRKQGLWLNSRLLRMAELVKRE